MVISASGFPVLRIALINIVVLMTMLGHRKYQYLFCRENQGKIICPHECPLQTGEVDMPECYNFAPQFATDFSFTDCVNFFYLFFFLQIDIHDFNYISLCNTYSIITSL